MNALAALWLHNAALVLGVMAALWLVSLALKNASIIDIFWGAGFMLIAWATFSRAPSERGLLVAGLVTLWGGRLSLFLLWRNWGRPEDARYQALRARYAPFWWKSIFVVFLLQGALLLVVGLPIPVAALDGAGLVRSPLMNGLTVLGVGLFAFGFVIESVADAQLAGFKHDPANQGRVMTHGLWSWSRHPNYFGELVLWWGIGLVALPAPLGVLALVGSATISFLLLRVSGVPMLEEQMKKRGPAYAEYIARTSAFVPRPPRL